MAIKLPLKLLSTGAKASRKRSPAPRVPASSTRHSRPSSRLRPSDTAPSRRSRSHESEQYPPSSSRHSDPRSRSSHPRSVSPSHRRSDGRPSRRRERRDSSPDFDSPRGSLDRRGRSPRGGDRYDDDRRGRSSPAVASSPRPFSASPPRSSPLASRPGTASSRPPHGSIPVSNQRSKTPDEYKPGNQQSKSGQSESNTKSKTKDEGTLAQSPGATESKPESGSIPTLGSLAATMEAGRTGSASDASKSSLGSLQSLMGKMPNSLMTYVGVKELSKHADSAKEWVSYFKELGETPEEVDELADKVNLAQDTIKQIKAAIEQRPDLVEGHIGENLKEQIDDAIKSANKTIEGMNKTLAALQRKVGEEGTMVRGISTIWHSYEYKNEFKEKIEKSDEDLQKDLAKLSVLMTNIYSRALAHPATPQQVHSSSTPEISVQPPGSRDTRAPTLQSALISSPEADGMISPKTSTVIPPSVSQAAAPELVATPASPPVAFPTLEESIPPSPPSPKTVDVHQEDWNQKPKFKRPVYPSPPAVPATNRGPVDPRAKPPPVEPAVPPVPVPAPPEKAQDRRASEKSLDPDEEALDDLLDAAWDGDIEAMARALRRAPLDGRDMRGLTALHLAAERDQLAAVMLLLDRGADVHARSNGGRMPLHLASRFASSDMVDTLLDQGHADINAETSEGRTPLHYAASSAEDGNEERREVIRVLRDWGANPLLQDRKGETPRGVAQKRSFWDAAATLKRAERKWDEDHRQGWMERHGF